MTMQVSPTRRTAGPPPAASQPVQRSPFLFILPQDKLLVTCPAAWGLFYLLFGFVLAAVGLPMGLPPSLPVPLALTGQDGVTVSTPTDVKRQGRKYANQNQLWLIVAISLLRIALK